jgi:hypothetical protein
MTRLGKAVRLAVLLLAPALALAQEGGEGGGDAPPPEKKRLSAAELTAKLDATIVSVAWKDTSVLDAISDLVSKSGLKIAPDATLAKFGGARLVTFRDFRISVKGALAKLRPEGVEVEPDEAAQGFRAFMPPEFPTECALREKKLTVKWKDVSLASAIAEIEKKTGVKIELADSVKARAKKKVSFECEDMMLSAAITALWDGVEARPKARPNLLVRIEFDGTPGTKAELEAALEDRGFLVVPGGGPLEGPLAEVASKVAMFGRIAIECDAKLKKAAPHVKLAAGEYKVKAALDDLAQQAGAAWKVDGAKVILRPK